MATATLFAPCYICGATQKVRECDACVQNVCPDCRVAQQPPDMMPQFYCKHCWEYLVKVAGTDGLYPVVPDPDTE